MIRLLVADDQAAIREALATVLDLFEDITVVGSAADGAAAVRLVAEQAPVDVVLMDLRMPGTDGVEATRQLAEQAPDTAVVVLSTFADEDSVLAALGAGARGYLTKDSGRDDIVRAVRAAAAGQAVLDAAVQQRVIRAVAASAAQSAAPARATPPLNITPREREVLGLIGAGLPNGAIAQRLFVSEATVKTHINNLFAKLDIRDRAEAVRLAIQHGLAS
ncbi:MAG TPA: response regulator transcription factor [Jatrophihabitans sp.]|nr:response regulator transcription factor [Jatrophihabitans sp.]